MKFSISEIEEMHQEDLADETRITDELTAPAVTWSQSAQMTSKQSLIQSPIQPTIVRGKVLELRKDNI
jgi:hypothetical protein